MLMSERFRRTAAGFCVSSEKNAELCGNPKEAGQDSLCSWTVLLGRNVPFKFKKIKEII